MIFIYVEKYPAEYLRLVPHGNGTDSTGCLSNARRYPRELSLRVAGRVKLILHSPLRIGRMSHAGVAIVYDVRALACTC